MYRSFFAGLLSGFVLSFLLVRDRLSDHSQRRVATPTSSNGREDMTTEEQVIAQMSKLIKERPDAATPDDDFLRSWAYGNAGLEDERITEEQVETVLRKKSA